MKILRTDAVAIAIGLGYKNAAKWSIGKMQKQFKRLVTDLEDDIELNETDVPADDERERLNGILSRIVLSKGMVEPVDELPKDEPVEVSDEEVEASAARRDAADPAEEDDDGEPELGDDAKAEESADGEAEAVDPQPEPEKKKRGRPKGSKNKPKDGDTRTPKTEAADTERAREKAVKPKKKSSRSKVLGKYSAGPFVRWLGRQGVKFEGAVVILEGEGCTLKEVSVKWELKEKREKCKPAAVSKDDAKALREKYPEAFSV